MWGMMIYKWHHTILHNSPFSTPKPLHVCQTGSEANDAAEGGAVFSKVVCLITNKYREKLNAEKGSIRTTYGGKEDEVTFILLFLEDMSS